MSRIGLIPPFNRVQILLARSAILEWTVDELRNLVQISERELRDKIPKGARMKESLNHRDLHGIGSFVSSRLLLTLLGMLTRYDFMPVAYL